MYHFTTSRCAVRIPQPRDNSCDTMPSKFYCHYESHSPPTLMPVVIPNWWALVQHSRFLYQLALCQAASSYQHRIGCRQLLSNAMSFQEPSSPYIWDLLHPLKRNQLNGCYTRCMLFNQLQLRLLTRLKFAAPPLNDRYASIAFGKWPSLYFWSA